MKRTSILAILVLALMFSQLGCGGPAIGTLKSIQLSSSSTDLQGEGGTAQLTATGNYSSNATKNLTINVAYVVTPIGTDVNSNPLQAPPNTITVSPTGLVTAVTPAVCTYEAVGTSSTPSWVLTGSYQIVATFEGVTSQPVYIGVASAAGSNASGNNPTLACGPTPSS